MSFDTTPLPAGPTKHPFNEEEKEAFDQIIKAHNTFMRLPRSHGSEGQDWCDAIHKLQMLGVMRAMRRQYPDYFSGIKKD